MSGCSAKSHWSGLYIAMLLCGTAFANGGGQSLAPGALRSAGTVRFSNSCSPEVQSDFALAVALLHSFFYEESRRLFTSVAERDLGCAIAQWGVAMTWWHPIWSPPTQDEFTAGRAAIERAKAVGAKTERERGYIDALDRYYQTPEGGGNGPIGQSCHGPITNHRDRVVAYETAMKQFYAKNPTDFETATFYALARLSVGYATPADITLSNQLKAAAILEKLWKKNPHHPGVAHYLIHSYDYLELATRGLPAARVYARIAPQVPHALHMPSHIFTRLGMWQESIDTNRASVQSEEAYYAENSPGVTGSDGLHALEYLVYAYLQSDQDVKAQAAVESLANVKKLGPEVSLAGAYPLGAIPARYVLERHAWAEAASLALPPEHLVAGFPFVSAYVEFARAIGRIHIGDVEGARRALQRMHSLHDAVTDPRFAYFRRQLELHRMAVAAQLAQAEGHADEAIAQLRYAAAEEDTLGKHPVSPGYIYPIRELLAELMLDLNRPVDALAAYEATLRLNRGRFTALYGAGRSAEFAQSPERARSYYRQLLAQSKAGDGRRPELLHAREFLSHHKVQTAYVHRHDPPIDHR